MITKKDLKAIAIKRFLDSKALLSKRWYHGCIYIGGFTIEFYLI